MNQIDNTFIKGMNLDLHPSAIPSDTLTTCLNGTIKTNNGNEGILQNDLGNVKLTYAHLPDGYVPLGMREYGGIVYVVSKNPFTNKCQIGSFPSPQQNQDNNDIFNGITTTASGIIEDFLYNNQNEYLVKHTRITKRLCERITEGTAFNIGNYEQASSTTPTSLMSFPSYVHYNNGEVSIDTINNSALVTLNLGIKNDQGSIQKIDSVNGTDSDEFNYLRTSGELYLIEELMLPPNEDFYILDVKKTNQGIELQFDYQGNLSFLTFSQEKDSDDIVDVQKDNKHDYYKVTFNSETELIRVFIEPSIVYNGNTYKIPQLKQEINIDVDDFSSQYLDSNSLTYQYNYTEFNNNLKISWGLVKAGNIEKVQFNLYLFNKENKTFNTALATDDKIVVTGKRTFNGFFTNQTSALVPNSLYLVEIQCDYKDDSTSQVYYKWAWTSEIVKQASGTFLLPLYAELTCDVVDTTSDLNPTVSDTTADGKLNYSKTYKKVINFTCSNQKSVYADLPKLPVKPIEISTTSPTLEVKCSELNKTLSQSGNHEITNKQQATATLVDNGIALEATYYAESASKQVEETYMGRRLKPYLENDEDYNTIFGGYQNEVPRYGIAIGAGSLKSGGVNHCYCFVDFNTWTSGGTVDTIVSKFVDQNNVKYKNTKGSDRKWKDVVEPNLQKIYNQQLGYYPPIGFIISPPSSDGRYNGEGRTSELCRMNSDCSTISNGSKHDYSLILWKDENESYKILRSVCSKKGGYSNLIKLFKNLYIMSDNVETYVASKSNVVDVDKYGYTSSNTIDVKVDVSVDIEEISNKTGIVNGIKSDIRNALSSLNKFTTDDVSAMVNLINIEVIPNNVTNAFSKEYSLEVQNILPDIQKHLQNGNNDTESSYCVMGNKVIIKDDDNANFKEGVIYYKTNNNGLATLNSTKGACGDLNGFDLSVMKNKFTLSKINKKQCIVLKSGLGLSSSPNTVWHNAHAAPFIGRYLSGNPHAETADNGTSGTYPFPLAAKNYDSYKYLCDFILKNDDTKLW